MPAGPHAGPQRRGDPVRLLRAARRRRAHREGVPLGHGGVHQLPLLHFAIRSAPRGVAAGSRRTPRSGCSSPLRLRWASWWSARTPRGYTGDLASFLFGQILGISDGDVALVCGVGAVLVGVTLAAQRRLVTVTLDRETAAALGLRVATWDLLVYLLVTVAIVISLQAVGNILVLALLVTPTAAARMVTDRLGTPRHRGPASSSTPTQPPAASSQLAGCGISRDTHGTGSGGVDPSRAGWREQPEPHDVAARANPAIAPGRAHPSRPAARLGLVGGASGSPSGSPARARRRRRGSGR